jgi:serine phosphatase RsbU (regulator of sigma subunit)/anti-sigma regulatory factor (Ser/Thr protein kinase)/PAS domain-containing protein
LRTRERSWQDRRWKDLALPPVPSARRIGRRRVRSHRLLLGALALLLVVGLVDVAVGSVVFVPLFVLAPLAVALRGGVSETAIAAGGAVAMAIVSGTWNSALGTGRWWVGLLLVTGGGVAAIVAAATRLRLQGDAQRLELLVELGDAARGATVAETADRLAEMLVPAVADACVIELAGEYGGRRVAAARAADTLPADTARRLGRSAALSADAEEATLVDPFPDREVGLRSCLGVPLHARGRTIGTLRLGVGPSGRRFGARDLPFAEVLADRVALALENAGLSAELEDAERRFRAIVDGMLDGVTVRAADGRLVYANDAAVDLLRMDSREELRELPPGGAMALFEVYDEDGRPVLLDELPGVRAWNLDTDPEPMIVRNVVRATGEQRWLLSKAIAIRDRDGVPMYVVNFTEDITTTKRVELAQRVLAEAGRVLVSSLDYGRTLQQVAMLAVPELADWCGVDMPGRGPHVEPVAVGHLDQERIAVARRLRERYPTRLDEPYGLAAVIRGDVPYFLVDETPDEALVEYAVDDEHLALMRAVGFNSIMIVPIVGREGILGALTFVSAHARRFDDDDLELAAELGRRAGVAVENARLYSERADIAHTLQVALVPDPVPLAPGWDVAALYRPAGEATEAGGDFYDMVRTDDGWLVVMGDVAGKGAQAASLTALARYTLRTAAMLTGDPGAALAALNVGLMRRDDVAYCTAAVVALVEGEDGEDACARIFSAGHPLPVLVRGGDVRPLGRSGPLLGALEAAEWPCEEVVLGAGDRLVLYTDGVTDARGPEDRFGDDRLLELLSNVDGAAPAEVVRTVDGALRGFEAGPQRDDTAVLAVARLEPGELALVGGPEAVSLARAAVRARLERRLPDDRLGDALLMTSELVTNAIRHGGAGGVDDRILLRVLHREPRTRVEVRDAGPGFSAAPPEAPEEGGMGLGLVDRLADAWGIDRRGTTTLVWFEVEPDRPGAPVH